MGENSKIEWTHHTFNPWIAETAGTRVKTSDANWRKPLKWNREAGEAGERRRVFCASLADVFEDWEGPIVDSKGKRDRLRAATAAVHRAKPSK